MEGKIRVIYYLFKVQDQPIGTYAKEIEKHLKYFVRLVNPDEYTLFENSKSFLKNSRNLYIIELRDDISRWFYLTTELGTIKKPEVAYEYEVGTEQGLEAVFRGIAEGSTHGRSRVDTFLAVLQVLLWGGFLFLSYIGYKNEKFQWINNLFLPSVFILSGTIEGFRRGYKKRRKP